MSNGYDSGRLNLPFVGIATFGKKPYVEDWSKLDADVAIIGAPFDFGAQYRSGARFGPRAVREASTLFSFGHAGAYDHEDDATYLGADVQIVDMGDADIVHTDTVQSHANIKTAVRAALDAGALPVTIGGDHSVNIPCIDAFDGEEDFPHPTNRRPSGFRRRASRRAVSATAIPMRRAAEKPYVTGLSQFGIRNVSPPPPAKDTKTPVHMGSDILSVRQIREIGFQRGRAPHPAGSPVRHHRHRRVLPLHCTGHRHPQPRWVFVLRGAGNAATGQQNARHHRDRSGRGRPRL